MVACPFRKSGCDFIGQLQLLTTHKKKCDFNPVNLPSFLKKDDSPSISGSLKKLETFYIASNKAFFF